MKQNGFTLLELSIVIVIIGLIVAGISAGQSLIHQAHIREAINSMGKYVTAANTFKVAYNYYPGDLPNATAYGWIGPIDGDGNGIINNNDSVGTCNNTGEHQWAWVHLSSADIIEGNYSWITHTPILGDQVPTAMGGKASYALAECDAIYGSKEGKNCILIANVRPNGWYNSCTTNGAAMSSKDALSIDTKLDDGIPDTGIVLGNNGRYPSTTWPSPACLDSGSYNLSAEGTTCRIAKEF